MKPLYLYSKVESSLLCVDAEEKLENPSVLNPDGTPADCPLNCIQPLEDGGFRYLFDASKLVPWSPSSPVLYDLKTGSGKVRFGHSELRTVSNRDVLLNGTPVYLRGYIRGIVAHDHPNMTGGSLKEAALKNIRQAKKYGFNLVRFHSTVPTPEFVEAADELGLLIHMEIGFAYEMDDKATKKHLSMDNKAWEETILRYRNHPSVAIFCIGNEMHNSGHYKEVRALYELGRRLAPGKLIMDNSGWGEFDRQTADIYSQHIAYFFPYKHHAGMFHSDSPWRMNGSAYDEKLDVETKGKNVDAEIHRTIVPAKPVIAHEAVHYIDIPDYEGLNRKFDDFCARVGEEYLHTNEIKKPRYMTELPALIHRKGLSGKVPDYIAASQQFKLTAIKTYLENCRNSSLCGFEMLQFSDCLKYENKNGIVDCFDDDKFIPSEWMRTFNDDAAILSDLENEVYYYGDEVRGSILISNFLPNPSVVGGSLRLSVKSESGEETVYTGNNVTLSGGLQKIADFTLRFKEKKQAAQVELCAHFTASGIELKNSWKLWLYPRAKIETLPELMLSDKSLEAFLTSGCAAEKDASAVMTDILDDKVFERLSEGKTVLLLYHRDTPGNQYYLPGALERFKPCIWDRGSNLGGIVYSERFRKALASGRYFDLNWYGLLDAGYKVCLDEFPVPVEEYVCGIDKPVRDRMKGLVSGIKDFIEQDTFRNFSHLFSVRAGQGTLIVCTFRMKNMENPVVANCLAELLNHLSEYRTEKSIGPEELRKYLVSETARGFRKEDVMNHFWEIDNKLVEDTLFWEQTGLDLSKIR